MGSVVLGEFERAMNAPSAISHQTQFQQRWPHLTHPHVRSLAWLLDSPILLNPHSDHWSGQLTELPAVGDVVANWLAELEKNPEPLIHYLSVHPHTRLGHYAEHLMAFYFLWRNELAAHSVQVRSHKTIGEFDFLLNTPSGLQHWEFACKFYLLVAPESSLSDYVGPNLMDNLQDKSCKIMEAQLALGKHPDAQKYLPAPLVAAKALLKGWLFYPTRHTLHLPEVSAQHCRGLWCRVSDLAKLGGRHFSILPRLEWLAPAKVPASHAMSAEQLQEHLTTLFVTDKRPVLVAQLEPVAEFLIESERIFVVPDDWNI